MKQVSRYHPVLAALHWILAVLIVGALIVGFFFLAATPNDEPGKIDVLRVHMAGGMLILALTIVRFIVRMLTAHPTPATVGIPIADRIAPLLHYGLYIVVVLMVATGYATGILAGLPAIVFAHSGDPLPPTFSVYPTFTAHGYLAALLVVLVGLHVLAALYHQWVRRDRLLSRMGFGRRME